MAGQDAQLLLKVGLDLTAFRQSLAGLGAASAGYSLPINIKLDRGTLNKELANLTTALGKKKFTVELNIAGGLTEDQLEKIQARLKTLAEIKKVEIPVSVKAGVTKTELRKVVASLNRSVRYSDALVKGKLRVPATIVSSITKADVNAFAADARRQLAGIKAGVSLEVSDTSINAFKEKIKSKLSGIAVDVTANVKSNFAAGPTGLAGLEEYMRTQGASGGHVSGGAAKGAAETARSVLFEKTVSEATNKDLKRMMQVGEVTGRSGLTTKSQMQEALMKLGSDAQEKILGNLKMQMSEPPRKISRSFLDQVARAVLWMAGVDPEYLRQQAAQPKKKQPQKPFGLLPSVTAKGSMEDMMRMLSGGGDGGESGKLALSSEQLKARVDAILRDYFRIVEVQVKEVFDAPLQLKKQINAFDYLVQALRDAEQAAKQSKIDAVVSRLINSIEEIINKAEANARASAAMSRLGQVNVREISNASFVKPGQLLLPQGEARKMLPGRPSQASILELNNILAGAIEAYFKSVAAGIRRAPIDRTPLIGPGGGGKGQLMLPAAGETTAFNRIRVTTGASVGQPAPMRAPSIPPPLLAGGGGPGSIPPSGGGGGRGGGFLGGMQFNRPQLPGAGAVEGLGVEFGMAAKQVLLFGTAYKALAFATDFPAQVGQAVSQLQSFRNTLNAITPSATEFGTSTKFIVSLVDQYNIPLQSTREGFAKLYASMKPAGFSGAEIRGLFEGISMGAATFGMSADKVDRVMYAFAQMASKGQVMSEELTGQLGDVLPGALALFARSAKMNVQEFGKAMKDGAFKGEAMRQLFINVGATMKEEFGPGAVGAALTFQGVMNRLQTSVVLFYEAFEPAAIIFANTFVLPLTNGIRVVTDGFKQLMTGQQAVTQGGAELAAQMQPLIPAFQGIAANLVKVGQAAATVIKGVMPVVQLMLQLAASPVVGWLAQMYASTLLLHGAFVLLGGNVLLGLIAGLARVAIVFAGVYLAATTTNTALVGTQLQLRMLSSGVAMTGAAMTGFAATVRAAMLTTAVGAVVVAVGIMISELMRLRGVQDEIEGRYKSLGDQARLMGESGNTQGIQRLRDAAVAQANTYEKIMQGIDRAEKGRAGKSFFNVDKETADLIKRAGQGSLLTGGTQISAGDIANLKAAINLNRERFKESEKINNDQMAKARRRQAEMDSASQKGLIPEGEGADEKARKKAAAEAEKKARLQDKLAGREQQLAIDAANRQTALDDSTFAHKLAMSDAHYDHLKALQEDSFNREMSGLDSIEARQKKFQQDLKAIESRRIESIRKAEIDAQKAVQDFRTASVKAGAASGGGGMGGGKAPKAGQVIDKSVFRDWMATQGFGRTTGDFTNAGHSTPNHMLNAMDMGILGGSDAEALRKTKAMEAKLAATGAFGDQLYGPTRDPYGHGAGKGGGNIHLHIPAPGGKIKVTPGLSQLMETGNVTTPRSQVGPKTGPGEYTIGRKEDKTSGQLAVEMLGMQQGEEKRLLAIRYANKLAIEQTVTTIKQNIDTIFPVKEQQLENDLLELRNKLELQGVSKEVIDMEVQKTKNIKESAAAQASAMKERISFKKELEQLQGKKTLTGDESIHMGHLVEKIAELDQEMATLPSKQEAFNVQLARTAELVAAQKTPQAILANTAAALKTQYAEMTNLGTVATNVASTISGAFGTAFQGVISGSVTAQQALSTFFQSVGEAFLDMAAKMIAKWMEMQIIGLAQQLLGAGLGAIGGGLGGFNLGGEGSGIGGAVGSYGGAMSPTTSLPSFSDSFGSFSGGGFGVTSSFGSFAGGVKTFAEGGIPPIGVPSLVGEQGPELFVPRSMGTIVPAGPTAGIREAMANGNGQSNVSPILNMTFQSSTINGVEYVSRDQLEAAMQETRRQASRDGAKRGMTMTLDKLQQSPATRSRIGI